MPRAVPPARPPQFMLWLLLTLSIAFHVVALVNNAWVVNRPTSGLLLGSHEYAVPEVFCIPTRAAVFDRLPQVAEHGPLRVHAVDGVPLHLQERPLEYARQQLASGRAQEVTLALPFPSQQKLSVPLERGAVELEPLVHNQLPYLLLHVTGMLYLVLGWGVWRSRPNDQTLRGFVSIGMVASVTMAWILPEGPMSTVLDVLHGAALPLFGVAGQCLVERSGRRGLPLLKLAVRATGWALALGYIVVAALALGRLVPPMAVVWMISASGTYLSAGLVSGVAVLLRDGSETTPEQHKRNRWIGGAALTAFLLPSLQAMVAPLLPPSHFQSMPSTVVTWGLLASFPVTLGYATLRYRLFDLRVVVARGASHILLSVGASLLYLVVVGSAVRRLDDRLQTPLALAAAVALVVAVASFLHAHVQRGVDRLFFRSRARFAEAVKHASQQLIRSRTLPAIQAILEETLLQVLGLRQATLALLDSSEGALRLHPVGVRSGDGSLSRLPATIPWSDSSGGTQDGPPSTPHKFYGETISQRSGVTVESALPLEVGNEEGHHRLLGFLLLCPAEDGVGIGSDERAFLETLQNQLAIALDHSIAFTELAELKAGLEATVRERTAALETALTHLERTQQHLVDTERQVLLGQLAAGFSHELNSPLGALHSSKQTLERTLEQCERAIPATDARLRRAIGSSRELLTVLDAAGGRLSSLVGALQSLSAETPSMPVLVEPCIRHAAALLSAEQRNVEVLFDLPSEPPRVLASTGALIQLFTHLLRNAFAALRGTGTVWIAVREENGKLVVRIADDGPGLPSGATSGLFDFSLRDDGAGRIRMRLGLPSCRSIVTELGGAIELNNRIAGGCEAVVTLPVVGS